MIAIDAANKRLVSTASMTALPIKKIFIIIISERRHGDEKENGLTPEIGPQQSSYLHPVQ